MLTTVLFDMGGTLEDIWHNEGTKREALQCVWDTLRAHGLEPEVDFGQFQELILEGIREYKTWCDLEFREKKPEERYPGVFIPEFAGFPYGGQLSFLPADVLAKEGVCHTKPAPVGR